ncbi:hypothetical protein QJS10_CPA01g02918 [Acorus calamus]|uniref:Uncharacterized protein n=1 Tax=Acorus calamus TaxID=4465 RepID=A0AAV9FLT6_ACOCL|nr:hypothetical protein QJS10_CPA01g02918 [Acorus calamus]
MEDNEDDCVVLDFNPFNLVSKKNTLHNDEELSIISSKGPIANREWPHWRHLCDNLPFEMTSHEKCCKKVSVLV